MNELASNSPEFTTRRGFVAIGSVSLAAATFAPTADAGLSDTANEAAAGDVHEGLSPNELLDPGFESAEVTWTPNRVGAAAVVDDAAPDGVGAKALQLVASGGQSAASNMRLIAVRPGELWFGQVWVKAADVTGIATDARFNLSVEFYSGGGRSQSDSFFVQAEPQSVSAEWRPFHGLLTVPRDADPTRRATAMRVSVSIKGVSAGSFRVDDLIVRRVPSGGLTLRDFGAIGDGAVDDTRAVQAALNFSAQYQTPVSAPAGRYAVASLVAGERSALVGAGTETLRFPRTKLPGDNVYTFGGANIIPAPNATSPLVTIDGGGVTLRNLTIDGYNKRIADTSSGADLVGLAVRGGFELRLDTVRVYRFRRTGIDVATMNNSIWRDIYVDNCGSADSAAVILRSGSDGGTNFCQFRGLTIERSANMAHAIGWGNDPSADYAEYLDFVGLHVEAARSGGGVLNTGPLIGIGNVTSVVFHAPQILGAPCPIIEYRQQFVDNQNNGKPQEGRLAYVDPTGTVNADQLGGVSIIGGAIIQNIPTPAPAPSAAPSILLTAGAAFLVSGTRFLRTWTAAVDIAADYVGGVVIDPSVTNRPYSQGTFVRDGRPTGSLLALRGPVMIGGHISTRAEAASISAVGGGPAPLATSSGLSDTRGSFAFGSATPLSGFLVRVTFGRAYESVPTVVLTPGDAKTQLLGLYVSVTKTDFTIGATNATAGSVPVSSGAIANAYQVNYLVLA